MQLIAQLAAMAIALAVATTADIITPKVMIVSMVGRLSSPSFQPPRLLTSKLATL